MLNQEEITFLGKKAKEQVLATSGQEQSMWTNILLKLRVMYEDCKPAIVDEKIYPNNGTIDMHDFFSNKLGDRVRIEYTDSRKNTSMRIIKPTEVTSDRVVAFCENANSVRQFTFKGIKSFSAIV